MRKFKIAEVSLGYFVIVKADVVTSVMPVNVHGIIRITGTGGILKADLMSGMSNELLESDEIESLKIEALDETVDAVLEEIND